MSKSLQQVNSKAWDVPVMGSLAIVLLIAGWFLPTVKLSKFIFGSDEYSIWQSVTGMWQSGDYILSLIIFFFSMIFPAAKLGVLGWVWLRPMPEDTRDKTLKWVETLGKWSMLDVFVVAVMVVLVKAKALLDAQPMYGIYVFAAAIVLSMIVSWRVNSLAKTE